MKHSKPMRRKRLTVEVIERRQVSFTLGQKVIDRGVDAEGKRRHHTGVIECLVADGAHVLDTSGRRRRWFVEYKDLRPLGDGRRYA